jgi:hypothetical protein
LQALAKGNVTPELGAACALAGARWPYATAARVLHDLCGAQVSHEEVRRWTVRQGTQEAQNQQAEAAEALAPTAEQVRVERDTAARCVRLGEPLRAAPPPERLTVGLDGGWLPSREQPGGMEGKVGVVATGVEAVGVHGRQRLSPRRYVATFGTSDQVGMLTYAAARALGGTEAREQVALGDGAAWIKTQVAWHFPAALTILDWAHVARALHKTIRAARPGRAHTQTRRDLHQRVPDLLWHGNLEATLAALRALRPPCVRYALRHLPSQPPSWRPRCAIWRGSVPDWGTTQPGGSRAIPSAVDSLSARSPSSSIGA